MKVKSENAVTN